MRVGYSLIMVIWGSFASAASLDVTSILPLGISSNGLNRLSLVGEGIKDVFLYPGNAQEYVSLHGSGDLFISPQEKGTTFSMTIMGQKGTKQDMTVTFKNVNPKPILLSHQQAELPSNNADYGRDLLKIWSMSQGDILKEFPPMVFEDSKRTLALNVSFETIGAYQMKGMTVLKGVLTNNSTTPYVMTPTSFPFARVVSFDRPVVHSGETATLYFIKKGRN